MSIQKDLVRQWNSSTTKAITVASPGVFRGTVAKFHFLKRFKLLENESIIQKYQHFSCPKNPIFIKKLRKIELFYKNFCIF